MMSTAQASTRSTRPNGGKRFDFESPQLLASYNQRSRQRDRYRRGHHSKADIDYRTRKRTRLADESGDEEAGQELQPTAYASKESPDAKPPVSQSLFTRIYQPNSRLPFVLSRQQKLRASPDSSSEGTSQVPDEDGSAANESNPPAATTRCVLHSHYLGDASIGLHNAQIIVADGKLPNTSKRTYPIFRWVHFEDNDMDFRSFQSGVSQISGLNETQSHGLIEIVDRVRQKFYRPLQTWQSSKARHVMPGMLQETCSPDEDHTNLESLNIKWSCIPYFCLERYSASSSNSRPFAHPMTTLLQSRSSLATKERDLQQAVCALPGTPPEHCFHIAQIWSLEVDDDLVVTYAPAPDSTMRGEAISMILPPTPQVEDFQCPTLLVSHGSSLMWALPIEKCSTWFAFTSHFWEYWPERYDFMNNNEIVGPDDWYLILKRAWKSQIRLTIVSSSTEIQWGTGILNESEDTVSPGSEDNVPVAISSNSTGTALDVAERRMPTEATAAAITLIELEYTTRGGLHVLTWPSFSSASPGATSNRPAKQDLEDDLKEMDQFLRWKMGPHQRLAYQRCPERTRQEVYNLIAARGSSLTISDDTDAVTREEYYDAVDFVNAADSIFQFFLPIGLEGPTVRKYWGSLYMLLEGGQKEHALNDFRRVLPQLKTLCEIVLGYTEPLSHAQASDFTLQMTDEFPQSWLHLLTLLISRGLLDASPVTLLRQGMNRVIQQMSQKNLAEYRIFTPPELASLMRLQLIRDVSHGHLDIRDTYEEYLMLLENNVQMTPLDRTHQDRLARFRQEVSVIIDTLREQEVALSQQDELIRRKPENDRRLIGHPNGSEAIEQLLVQDSLALVDDRIRSFSGMLEEASDLEAWNIQKIDTNKDRQEAAIYVFTVVTIIFLPLSTVASILGMNTYDVRNMRLDQWIFWAISIPLAVIIIVVSLVCAGEWSNFMVLLRFKSHKLQASKSDTNTYATTSAKQEQIETKSSNSGVGNKASSMSRRRASLLESQEEV